MSAIDLTPAEIRAYAGTRLPELKKQGSELRGKCPVHAGKRDSFAFNLETGLCQCFSECGRGWDVIELEEALTGVDFQTALADVQHIVGRNGANGNGSSRKIVRTYDYTDEAGQLLFQVVRFEPKDFRQRRPDGNGGWTWNLHGITPVLYNLPAVVAADVVYIVEGEKDVESLEQLGLVATCNAGGASQPDKKPKWRAEYSEALRGKTVAILPDNDAPGRAHAQAVATSLHGVAARVRIVELPDLPEKGDISDWIAAGGTREQLEALAADAPDYRPGVPVSNAPAVKLELPPLISAADLYRGEIVRLRPLFDGLLWDGLTMLVARPKAGKSWLTLQIAVHVAGGRTLEGITGSERGVPVLYGAFEEPQGRTMARLRQICSNGAWAANLQFVYDLLPLMGGGAEQLEQCIAQLRPRLVVIDTLTAVIKNGGKRENDVFRSQYAEVSTVRKIAENARCAILIVHHTRKGMSDGAIEAVAGTGGIAAAVDTLWLLKKKPEGEATLDVIGREIEEKTFAMRFDQSPFGWSVLGDDADQLLNAERREILALLREDGAMTPAQVAAELAKSRPAVRQLLKRMRDSNQVVKQGSKYLPPLSL